jgi:iron complex outermembrane recepter protein
MLPIAESIGKVSVGATYVYTASQVASRASPFGVLPSSNLLNVNAAWNDVLGQPVDLSFFITNVTNALAPGGTIGFWVAGGYDGYIVNPPRMWGFRLKYRFGN